MTRRENGSASFEPPVDWTCRQVTILARPEGADDESANILVTREERRGPGALQAHAMQQVMDLSKSFARMQLLELSQLQLGGRPAVRARLSSETAEGPVVQVLVWVDTPEGDVLTLTCSRLESIEASLPVFHRMLESLKFVDARAVASVSGLVPPPTRATPLPPAPAQRWGTDDLAAPPMVPMPGTVGHGRR